MAAGAADHDRVLTRAADAERWRQQAASSEQTFNHRAQPVEVDRRLHIRIEHFLRRQKTRTAFARPETHRLAIISPTRAGDTPQALPASCELGGIRPHGGGSRGRACVRQTVRWPRPGSRRPAKRRPRALGDSSDSIHWCNRGRPAKDVSGKSVGTPGAGHRSRVGEGFT